MIGGAGDGRDRALGGRSGGGDLERGVPAAVVGAGVPPGAGDRSVRPDPEQIQMIGGAGGGRAGALGGRSGGGDLARVVPAAVVGAGVPPGAGDRSVRPDPEQIQMIGGAGGGRAGALGGRSGGGDLARVVPAAVVGAGVPPGAGDRSVRPDPEQIQMIGGAGDGRDRALGGRSGGGDLGRGVAAAVVGAGVPPGAGDRSVRPDPEQIQMIGGAGDGRDRALGGRSGGGDLGRGVAAAVVGAGVPPGAGDRSVRPDPEQIQMIGGAGDGRDRALGGRSGGGDLERGGPGAVVGARAPPGAGGRSVRPDPEQIQMIGGAGGGRDRALGGRSGGGDLERGVPAAVVGAGVPPVAADR